MFWTELLAQRGLFGDDYPIGSATVSHLIRSARDLFGEDVDQELHRQFAFLTHISTQCFLRPMLTSRFGSIEAAKIPTLNWLNELGSLETFARSTRKTDYENGKRANCERRVLPAWYTQYLQSQHWQDTRNRAAELWGSFTMQEGLRCNFNIRHLHEEWHHSDYGRWGEADEFRLLVPLCHECHHRLRIVGPSVPESIPEGVKQWL